MITIDLADIPPKINGTEEEYAEAQRLLYKHDLKTNYEFFFRQAWTVLEPETPLINNFHIRYFCRIIQLETERVARREFKTWDYIVNVPPRTAKSKIWNVCWCPWAWTRFPHLKFINNSYDQELATSLCLESRRLIESDWYQAWFGDVFQLTTDQNTKSWFENNKKGMRRSGSTRGGITGSGADFLINDDPQNPEKAESEIEREQVKRHWGKTMYSRLNNQRIGLRVIIQQRLHEDDLTGHLMLNDKDKYRHIVLPAELNEDVKPKELRKYFQDGLLFPAHPSFTRESLAEAQLPTNLGVTGYSAQYLQRPSPAGGDIFKKIWWNYWKPKGMELPPVIINISGEIFSKQAEDLPDKFDEKISSWDLAFKDSEGSCRCSGDIWAKYKANKYLLNNLAIKMDFPKTIDAVRLVKKEYPDITAILIEDKANGPAVIASLKREIAGIIPIAAETSKTARALPMARQAQSGNIYLPHPAIAKWVQDWIEEYNNFPNGRYDDRVDSGAHGINFLSDTKKKVLAVYNSNNQKHYDDFKLNWKRLLQNKSEIICSVYQYKNLETSLIACLWDAIGGQLYIINEAVSQTGRPDDLLPMFNLMLEEHRNKVLGLNFDTKKFTWYGNKEMFGITGNQMKTAKDGTANLFYDYSIPLQPNLFFDLTGAITITSRLLYKQRLTVHSRCKKMNLQFKGWNIENDRPDNENVGLCLALMNMISCLHQSGKFNTFLPKLKEYTPEKMKARAELEAADRVGNLSQMVARNMIPFEKKPRSKIVSIK